MEYSLIINYLHLLKMINYKPSLEVKILSSNPSTSHNFIADDFVFTPVKNESPAGVLYDCSLELNITLPTKQVLDAYSYIRKCIVTLYTDAGTPIIIGTEKMSARVLISPHLNRAKLYINCNMLQSPI